MGAQAIFQNLTHHGYDVFLDFDGIASGDFESVILENIRARAHFLVLLTPSALERCDEPGDWLRREIEAAFENRRNIVPLMLEGFNFRTPTIASQLTGTLAPLKSYNALRVPDDLFDEAMERLRTKYLNVPLDVVPHPASVSAARAAKVQQAAAVAAPKITDKELTAQKWLERGFNVRDREEKIRCYSEAIRLKPNYSYAFYYRGMARKRDDLKGAFKDFEQAIRLKPDFVEALIWRAELRRSKDRDGGLKDYNQAIGLKPDYASAYYHRGTLWCEMNNFGMAIGDFEKYLSLGGGERYGDTQKVKQMIRSLKQKL